MKLLLVVTSCLAHLIAVGPKNEDGYYVRSPSKRTACHRTSPTELHGRMHNY